MLKLLGGIILVVFGTSGLTWTLWLDGQDRVVNQESPRVELSESEPLLMVAPPAQEMESTEKPEVKAPVTIEYTVPFTSQAPTSEWEKRIFQDGCEEASVLMVKAWLSSETFTKASAREKISALALWQQKKIGHSVDTDAARTQQYLLEEYLGVRETVLQYDFTLDELIEATQAGIVIVPTNGRKLGNPNFKIPGPLQHMLIIKGYDALRHEFITNDPGTRKGEGYRYPEAILYAAIRDYPTGKHLPIEGERKAMIFVPEREPRS